MASSSSESSRLGENVWNSTLSDSKSFAASFWIWKAAQVVRNDSGLAVFQNDFVFYSQDENAKEMMVTANQKQEDLNVGHAWGNVGCILELSVRLKKTKEKLSVFMLNYV